MLNVYKIYNDVSDFFHNHIIAYKIGLNFLNSKMRSLNRNRNNILVIFAILCD